VDNPAARSRPSKGVRRASRKDSGRGRGRLLRKLPTGLDAFVNDLLGLTRRLPGHARALRRQALACTDEMTRVSSLSHAQFHQELVRLRELLRLDPADACGQLPAALAVVGEAAWRSMGKRPYQVQLMTALALHQGWLAEMATGEGKTLSACLAAVLAAWSGNPLHLITANDYLAERDAQEMGALYEFCGLSCASVTAQVQPEDRPARYAADVVYVTAKELLADFLRDRQSARGGEDVARARFRQWLDGVRGETGTPLQTGKSLHPGPLLVRGLHTAVVDEADSVMIDEAVTPLILAVPHEGAGLFDAVEKISAMAGQLRQGHDYSVSSHRQLIVLGYSAREQLTVLAPSMPPLWRAVARREELLRQALFARHFLVQGQHYVVQEGKIVLLDEGSGRLMVHRTLTAGLHQAVEAKEGVEVTPPTGSLAQMSFQAFFRQFLRLSGTTGTAREATAEFWRIYGLGVLPVPTHRPRIRTTAPAVICPTEDGKWAHVLAQVERMHASGRPVLVGVRSVGSSEHLAALLQARSLPFQLLNALRHDEEAEIVAQAGQRGRITVATNMAGRGTDIKLGEGIHALGGLHVVIAECNESARVDRQLAGRCGRQGDAGSVATVLSLEDAMLPRHFSSLFLRAVRRLVAFRGDSTSAGTRDRLGHLVVRMAQVRAERQSERRRKAVFEADSWMEKALPFVNY
jgi:preprotein translocase subunit SecA